MSTLKMVMIEAVKFFTLVSLLYFWAVGLLLL